MKNIIAIALTLIISAFFLFGCNNFGTGVSGVESVLDEGIVSTDTDARINDNDNDIIDNNGNVEDNANGNYEASSPVDNDIIE